MFVLSWLWGIVKSVLNSLAKVVVAAIILILVLVAVGLFKGDGVPRTAVLELDLRQGMDDKSSTSLLDLGGSFVPDLTGRENARLFRQIVERRTGDVTTRERAIEPHHHIHDGKLAFAQIEQTG